MPTGQASSTPDGGPCRAERHALRDQRDAAGHAGARLQLAADRGGVHRGDGERRPLARLEDLRAELERAAGHDGGDRGRRDELGRGAAAQARADPADRGQDAEERGPGSSRCSAPRTRPRPAR
jgi:hypothetical protein